MPNKTQIYAQVADDTARKITKGYLRCIMLCCSSHVQSAPHQLNVPAVTFNVA